MRWDDYEYRPRHPYPDDDEEEENWFELDHRPRANPEVVPAAWRLFVAVELDRDVLAELDRRQRILDRWARSSDVRVSGRQALHLTLRFIGDVDPKRVDDLKRELTKVASQSRRIQLELGDNGCFPGERTPRVLWAGIDGDIERLRALVNSISGALHRLGIGEEVRQFVPHVTLARVRGGTARWTLGHIGEVWTEYEGRYPEVPVRRLTLFHSQMRRGVAPRYERLHTADLA